MALIGTIRKNGWILIATMILALGGFILMDVMSNSQNYAAGDANTLGEVEGKTIKRDEFEQYTQTVYPNRTNTYQIRSQAWDYFVEEAVISKEAEKIGLGVCKDELNDLQFGSFLSPIVMERFKGNDGRPNFQVLNSIKSSIEQGTFTDANDRAYWAVQEKEIIKQRLEDKILAMVSKGVFTPSWQAEMTFRDNNERRDYQFVRIGYDRVKDEEAPVTDADYQAFLKENPKLYTQTEESRVVSFVAVSAAPTAADTLASRDLLAKLVDGLRNASSDSAFVVSNNGQYDPNYKTKDALPANVADTLLRLPVGSLVGPFIDGNSWSIAKISNRKLLPDSVRARHLLIREATPVNEARVDSLMGLIRSGKGTFDSLAIKNSQDPGSGAKGGDLGWFANGQMVPEFNEVCFYTGEQGKLYKVATQFGWHIIEITGKKFIKNEAGVKVAMLSQRIEPSTATQQLAKDRATAIAQQAKSVTDLKSIAESQGLSVQESPALKANDFTLGQLGSGDDVREIVRWAFNEDTKAGSVSKDVFAFRDAEGGFFDSKYIVTGLKGVAKKGDATVASLKALPEATIKVRNARRAAFIKEKVKGSTDLAAIASQWQIKVDTARGANMMQSNEPRLIGTIFNMAKDAVTAPIEGNGGVYVASPINDKPSIQPPADLGLFRRQVTSQGVSSVRVGLVSALVKAAKMKDNRSRFY